MLNISVERNGKVAVLRCVGRIVVGEKLAELREAVLCQLDKPTIILDLANVDRIDAGGLGLLVFLHVCTNGLGSELKLVAPSPQVAEVLQLSRLDSVFTISTATEGGAEPAPLSAPRWQACA